MMRPRVLGLFALTWLLMLFPPGHAFFQPRVPLSFATPSSYTMQPRRFLTLRPAMHDAIPDAVSFTATTTAVTTVASEHDNLLDSILSFPAFWSLSIMVTLVALLYVWEFFVETIREQMPHTFLPVFEKMWAEVAGLGFIGLVLQVLVHPFEPALAHLSEEYLGEEEILLESFEFLHTAFFQVGIAFFAAAGYQVAVSLRNIDSLKDLETIGTDKNDGTCMATSSRLVTFLDAPSLPPRDTSYSDQQVLDLIPRTNVWEELELSSDQRNAQSLLVRAYKIQNGLISEETNVESLIESRFSTLLLELVELSPLTWLPLIPALALANSVDLSHDVVNSASPNAEEAAGFFFSSPEALLPSLAIVSMSTVWGLVNFWKLSEIKSMMLPTLVEIQDGEGATSSTTARIIPPRSTFTSQMEQFSSSPRLLAFVEQVFARKEETPQEKSWDSGLFGAAGNADFYLASIRFHTWLCITAIVFFGTQIIPRDLQILLQNDVSMAGDPASVLPEFLTYSFLVTVSVALLALSPTTL